MLASLKPGDTVAIVSPASPLEPKSIQALTEILESEGYRVQVAQNAFARNAYLAGTDEQRANDLLWAFGCSDVNGILCSRGGYGCARLLKHLDLDMMAASRKLFAGFSDVTTLHLALNRRGLETLHAPMGITLSTKREAWVYESFRDALKGQNPIPPTSPRATTVVPGIATGMTTGGCLCLITDSIGTPDAFDATGKIVLIEDVDEAPHRVDAMLTHLLNTGNIQRASGIVIGEMTRTDDKVDDGIGGRPWRDIVQERLAPLGIPMVIDFPFGHAKQMLTLPLGVNAHLNAEAGTLRFPELES
jgi:muramoyltetrapeptide carboxypeptidase